MRSIEDKGCYNHGQIQEISSNGSISFEFHKVNGTIRGSHHRTALGKPTPSKWDDAQKWLAGLSRGGGDKKQSITQPRNSNADDRRLIAPVSQPEPDFSCQGEENAAASIYKVETKNVDCEESIWRINKHVKDTMVPVRSICVRDMGTEMTPIASQEPSRTGTPIRATTPVGRSPITSGPSTPERCQNGVMPMPCVNVRETDCVDHSSATRQCVEDFKIPDSEQVTKNNPLETRALAWDEAERAKYTARYKREEVKIQAWENHQKRKAEMEMKKMEAKAERMKARAQEKLTNKLAATKRIAEEKRANAEANLNEKAMKTSESADYIRRTGHMPSSFSFKMPSLCW